MSVQGCIHSASQEVHPTAGESPTKSTSLNTIVNKSVKPVETCRRDTGTFLLGHASSPSLGRLVADFLSAHIPRTKVPVSRLKVVGSVTAVDSVCC